MRRIYDFCGGKSTFFALVFTGFGVGLSFRGELTSAYVALVGAVQALIVGRAIADDYHERNCGSNSSNSR